MKDKVFDDYGFVDATAMATSWHDFDLNTVSDLEYQNELLKSGTVGNLWGVNVIETPLHREIDLEYEL